MRKFIIVTAEDDVYFANEIEQDMIDKADVSLIKIICPTLGQFYENGTWQDIEVYRG